MVILPSKARPTWAGVLVRQPGGDRLVPWSDAVDLRVVRLDGRWVRIDFDLSDEKRARALRRRAIRNLWRAGEPVTWRKPVIGPAWLELVGLAIPVACCITLGAMMLTFAISRMMTLNSSIRAEGISPELGAALWALIILVAIGGVGVLWLVWYGIGVWRREPLSGTIQGDNLTLARRDRTIVIPACEVVRVKRGILGSTIETSAGEMVTIGQVCPAVYEPWLRTLPLAGDQKPLPSLWLPHTILIIGLLLAGAGKSASSAIAVIIMTSAMAAVLVWAHRYRLSNTL